MTARIIMNVHDAAIYLSIDPETLKVKCRAGTGPAFCKIGTHLRAPYGFFREDLDAYLQRLTLIPAYPGLPRAREWPAPAMTDAQWVRARHALLDRSVDSADREFIDLCFWVCWHGRPWGEIPARYGDPMKVKQKFERWGQERIWERVLKEILSAEPRFPFRIAKTTSILAVREIRPGGSEQVQGELTIKTSIPYGRRFRTMPRQRTRQPRHR